jgi:hypothetical protein
MQTSQLPNQNTKTKHPITLHIQHKKYTAHDHRPTRVVHRDIRICSLDIYNMYTYIPTKKSHHYNTNYIKQPEHTTKQCKEIGNITHIVLSQNYFKYNNNYYRQKKD